MSAVQDIETRDTTSASAVEPSGVEQPFTPPDDAEVIESVADLVAKRKRKPEKHYLKSLSAWVWLHPLSALDQRDINRMQVKKVQKINEITGKEEDGWEFDPIGLPLTGVAFSWTNSKGQRLKGEAAIQEVGQLDPAVIAEAWEIVATISNWGGAEKNSVSKAGGNGSSSSP